MILHAGHCFPDGLKPTAAPHAIKRRDKAFPAMAPYFPPMAERRLAVQAGGMTGLWALEFLRFGFDRVVTFEPAPHVWPCLIANTQGARFADKITAYNQALGPVHDVSGIVPNSLGSSYLEANAPHVVSVVPLDSLRLPRLDYLQLDLEGYEYPALLGARETIRKFKPPIQVEFNGTDKRYAWGETATRSLLTTLGYRERAKIPGSDFIFTT